MREILKAFGSLEEDVSLKDYNTYKINSYAKYLIRPYNIEDLIKLLKYLKENNVKYFILGNGSNVILSDNKFDGVIIKLDYLNEVKIKGLEVYVEAGVMINSFSLEMINNNLKGLEWATGIPGTIGGGIVGNAGAYNACIFDYIKEITFLDEFFYVKTLTKDEIDYGYRYSMFKNSKNIILSCVLELKEGTKEGSMELVKDRLKRRMESQPLEYPSAGSVFRNPEDIPAGKIIEDLGFKGKNIGGAYVSEKHANFIINKKNATSSDIIKLIDEISGAVKKEYGIDLHLEQEIIKW